MKSILARALAAASALALAAAAPPARACTSVLLPSADGGHVYARTLEFGLELHSQLLVIPRKLPMTATGPVGLLGKGGLEWTTRYAAVGANGLGLPILVDGVNEKGLAGGLFNFPVYAQYQEVGIGKALRSIASFELVTWVLTSFATIDEIKEALPKILVTGVKVAQFGNAVPQVHYVFHDASGRTLVVEYTDHGQLHMYENPAHAFTNAPAFPFQLENLAQYQYVTARVLPPIQAGSLKLSAASSGDGMNGLPAGWLASARFVRAFFAQQNAPVAPTSADAVGLAFHLMNGFDIPPGSVGLSAGAGESGGVGGYETTEWTGVADMKALRYHIRTFGNPDVRYVDLRKADLDAKSIRYVPVDQPQAMRDLTP